MRDKAGEPGADDLVRLSVFSSIVSGIMAEQSITGVLDRLMDELGSYFGPHASSLLLLDSGMLNFASCRGPAADSLLGMAIPGDEGLAAWVAKAGLPLLVGDAASDARFSDRIDRAGAFRTRTSMLAPLRSEDRVFGVIELDCRQEDRSYAAADLLALSTIVDFAAIAVEKAYYLAEARRLSELDPLTGARNRRGLRLALDRETLRAARYGGEFSVILADVEGFKAINETFGRAAGDSVLALVAETLIKTVRDVDSVARHGGDEFIVLLPATGPEEAEIARLRLGTTLDALGRGHEPPFGVGLAVHSPEDLDLDALLREPDRGPHRLRAEPLDLAENLLGALNEERRYALDSEGQQGGRRHGGGR
ncbi:MAG TPA: sensor domain-containing diguanylate cyclase [Rectinemataceae bacterium]|nr:sensor domain-containing diguanylate cyclase [Rectinemataceae bacterium]